MYKDMITLANTALKAAKRKFNDDEKQFIVFFAYKTGDLQKTRELIKEMEEVKEPEQMDEVFRNYSKQMELKSGIEHLAETILVCIERYRLEQENAIGYLAATLQVNGIRISDEEIRNTEMLELKEKISKEASR